MNSKLQFLLIIAAVLFFSSTSWAIVTRTTVKDGAWTDAATWGGTLPQWNDVIVINHNVTATDIEIGWNQSLTINFGHSLIANSIDFKNGEGVNHIYGSIISQDVINSGSPLYVEATGVITVSDDFETKSGSSSILYVYGLIEVTDDFTNDGGAVIYIEDDGEIIVHDNFTNKSGVDLFIDGGTLTVDGTFDNQADGYFSLTNGGTITIGENMVNTGGSEFDITLGSISIVGNFTNQGGSEVTVASGGSMDVSGDFTNTGGGDIEINGDVNVDGTLNNGGGSYITGNGTLSVGALNDTNNGVSSSLLIISRIYAIRNGNWNDFIWSKKSGGPNCNCLPNSTSYVMTENFDIDINISAEIHAINVSENTTLNILPTSSLTANGTIFLNGEIYLRTDGFNSGVLLNRSSIDYGANSLTKSRVMLKGNEYNYIASSIENASTDAIKYFRGALNPNVFIYNETAADHWGTPNDDNGSNDFTGWASVPATMNQGQGFAVYVPENYYIDLSGSAFLTGNQNITITETLHPALPDNTTYDGWNLIGNPYPSGLELDAFIQANLANSDGNIYLWDDDQSGGTTYNTLDYVQVNLAGIITNSKGSVFSGSLKPNQGFFIKATASANTVLFTDAMRNTQNSTFMVTSKTSFKKNEISLILLYELITT